MREDDVGDVGVGLENEMKKEDKKGLLEQASFGGGGLYKIRDTT